MRDKKEDAVIQKYIIGKNGTGYILGEDGMYHLSPWLPESSDYPSQSDEKVIKYKTVKN